MKRPGESTIDYIERLNRRTARIIAASVVINLMAIALIIAKRLAG